MDEFRVQALIRRAGAIRNLIVTWVNNAVIQHRLANKLHIQLDHPWQEYYFDLKYAGVEFQHGMPNVTTYVALDPEKLLEKVEAQNKAITLCKKKNLSTEKYMQMRQLYLLGGVDTLCLKYPISTCGLSCLLDQMGELIRAKALFCANCQLTTEDLLMCGGCGVAAYCTQACQVENRKIHRPFCDAEREHWKRKDRDNTARAKQIIRELYVDTLIYKASKNRESPREDLFDEDKRVLAYTREVGDAPVLIPLFCAWCETTEKELVYCDCGLALYCSEECHKGYWKRHSYLHV